MALPSEKLPADVRSRLWARIVKKESEALPDPIFFSESLDALTSSVTEKVTEIDHSKLAHGIKGLSDSAAARYIQIRKDLEKSTRKFPPQKFKFAVTTQMDYGWERPTATTLRSQRKHSRPRKSTELSKFTEAYVIRHGHGPFQKDIHTLKQK